jgi:hypothetical protein
MSGPILHVGAAVQCPHGGQVATIAANARVTVAGMAVATMADAYPISGCPFTVPPGKPRPCVTLQWQTAATRVQLMGQPVVIVTGIGLCLSAAQVPQGPASVLSVRLRVIAT